MNTHFAFATNEQARVEASARLDENSASNICELLMDDLRQALSTAGIHDPIVGCTILSGGTYIDWQNLFSQKPLVKADYITVSFTYTPVAPQSADPTLKLTIDITNEMDDSNPNIITTYKSRFLVMNFNEQVIEKYHISDFDYNSFDKASDYNGYTYPN